MIDLTWDGNPDTLAQMEAQVRTADWVTNRLRSLYTSGKITATQVQNGLEAVGVLPDRIDQYLQAWSLVVSLPAGRGGNSRQRNAPGQIGIRLPNPAAPLPPPLPRPGDIGIGAGVAFEYPPSTGGGRRG